MYPRFTRQERNLQTLQTQDDVYARLTGAGGKDPFGVTDPTVLFLTQVLVRTPCWPPPSGLPEGNTHRHLRVRHTFLTKPHVNTCPETDFADS